MSENSSRIAVFFEEPFWVCVFERWEDGKLSVSRSVFGACPRDGEVYLWLLEHWHRLRFSRPTEGEAGRPQAANPKRRQRQIAKDLARPGAGTKAQQALAAQREASKQQAKRAAREDRAEAAQRQFELKQQKKKEKHRGH